MAFTVDDKGMWIVNLVPCGDCFIKHRKVQGKGREGKEIKVKNNKEGKGKEVKRSKEGRKAEVWKGRETERSREGKGIRVGVGEGNDVEW